MAHRLDGYAAIRDYAAIGDGRTMALVARDGSIDWLCLPMLDSPSVFGAALDAGGGGRFALAPTGPFWVTRRYLPVTNVLETTFHTDGGVVRVTDAMTLPDSGVAPQREVARRIEGDGGQVSMQWAVTPRFGYGQRATRLECRSTVPVATSRADAIAVLAWNVGAVEVGRDTISGRFDIAAGERAMIALSSAHQQPLVLPSRDDVERRLDGTVTFWNTWIGDGRYGGPWREAVERSALALKLLVHAPSGAVAAAATTSLPETIGGERNWDYRYCWIRDSAFTLDAMLRLGFHDEAHAFFWWFMHATALTNPRVQVLYRLDGSPHAPERELTLEGYRGSRPVRLGNGAAAQHQLDLYGDLFHTAWLYHAKGFTIDRDTGRELAEIADHVCASWRQPDRGIWEVRMAGKQFTHSKAMCWVALERALRMAKTGVLPSGRIDTWQHEADAIHRFIETHCWSPREESYARYAGTDEVDASLLLMPIMEYQPLSASRMASTVRAVQRRLADGPLVNRYDGADGLQGAEGRFVCCSFWLAHALAVTGQQDAAAEIMEQTLALANDVGLFAEEMDASTHAFLGNFPQGLVHLALVNAAVALSQKS